MAMTSRDDGNGQALEKRHSFDECRLESDLAVHGARGDCRDLFLQADFRGQLVDAFLSDHGGVHVGDQKSLAAAFGILHGDVDRGAGDRLAQPSLRFAGLGAIPQYDVAGNTVREPIEPGCIEPFRRRFRACRRQNGI
ncbi:hypothetical protein ACVINY_000743 [Sinorhizobium meliloti]